MRIARILYSIGVSRICLSPLVSWKLAVSRVSSPTFSTSLSLREARRSWALTLATISTGLKGLAI